MNKSAIRPTIVLFFFCGSQLFLPYTGNCQQLKEDSNYVTVIAGPQYAISERQQKKWGENYRQEWNTPVRIKKVLLDTLAGGLTPYQAGGGRQTKSLRMRDAAGREYVLRSVDKSFGGALPEIVKGTFVEDIADDLVSIGHPYSSVTIQPMIEAAGIYHTKPEIIFIPKQPRLGKYNEEYGDVLYLFEQRPDEDWKTADNFGNSENLIGTEKLLEKITEDNKKQVDQLAFVRARLFDFLIGDGGRHEDQWRWATIKKDDKTIYRPIPRDRDQAYALLEGKRTKLVTSSFDHLQSFDSVIRDINTYNFPARNLDRRMSNEVTLEQWVAIAKDLQTRITDNVIETAIRKMPPEVFPISGPEIIATLKSRRDHLTEYATTYYLFLAENTNIVGSDKKEYFEVSRLDNEHTLVSIYDVKKDGSKAEAPFYKRNFLTSETKEIRLYGLGADDIFNVSGKADNGILLRLMPGKGDDSLVDNSSVQGRNKMTRVYDNKQDQLTAGSETHLHISKDTTLTNYKYKHFEYDSKGLIFKPGLTIGLGYHFTKQKWGKYPFGSEHRITGFYGPNRGSFGLEYRYIVNQFLGKWNMETIARADLPFVANFFGIGNETTMDEDATRKFYRYRSTVLRAGVELNRIIDSSHQIIFHTQLQSFKLKNDADRFISKILSGVPIESLGQKYFITSGVAYQYKKSDDKIIPTKGFEFNLAAAYTKNLRENKDLASYSSSVSVYIPFLKVLSLASRVGGATVTGDPEFYQLTTLSGKENLRGHRRQRFYGKTSFYNNNELRLILNTRNHVFNGKIGLLAFLDQGRIWQPGEDSDTWHVGYGGGFFVAPFNKILLNASYGFSKDDRTTHLRVGFMF